VNPRRSRRRRDRVWIVASVSPRLEFRPEARSSRQSLYHLIRGQNAVARPDSLRIERHEFNEANFDSMLASKAGQRHQVGSNKFLTATALILSGPIPNARNLDAFQNFVEIVTARDAKKALAVQRVQMDIEPAQSGVVQRLGMPGQQNTVGGQRNIVHAQECRPACGSAPANPCESAARPR